MAIKKNETLVDVKTIIKEVKRIAKVKMDAARELLHEAADVNDRIETFQPLSQQGIKKPRRVDPRIAKGIIILASYKDTIKSPDALTGTIEKVFSVVRGTPVERRLNGAGFKKTKRPRICVVLEQEDGNAIVDIYPHFHRYVGDYSDNRIQSLSTNIPPGTITINDSLLMEWYVRSGFF